MTYRCRECRGILYEEEDARLHCRACGRFVAAPGRKETPIPNHGLARKDLIAGNAYQDEPPEFPFKENEDLALGENE